MKRRLSREEAQIWARVAQTVAPLHGKASLPLPEDPAPGADSLPLPPKKRPPRPAIGSAPPPKAVLSKPASPRPLHTQTLDATWDRQISRGIVAPDFTLDLHGHSLDAAHARLDHGLAQARTMGARLVLVITGLPRSAEAADRGNRRGAIRAKLLDWLAHGSHGSAIAAVRPAHRRHGGAGAVYVVLRRPK